MCCKQAWAASCLGGGSRGGGAAAGEQCLCLCHSGQREVGVEQIRGDHHLRKNRKGQTGQATYVLPVSESAHASMQHGRNSLSSTMAVLGLDSVIARKKSKHGCEPLIVWDSLCVRHARHHLWHSFTTIHPPTRTPT